MHLPHGCFGEVFFQPVEKLFLSFLEMLLRITTGVLELLTRVKGLLYVMVALVVCTSQNGTSLFFRPTYSSKHVILTGYSLEDGSEEQNNPFGDAVLDATLEVGCPLGFRKSCCLVQRLLPTSIPRFPPAELLSSHFSLFVLVPSVTSSQVQNPVFGLGNYHAINDCPTDALIYLESCALHSLVVH